MGIQSLRVKNTTEYAKNKRFSYGTTLELVTELLQVQRKKLKKGTS